MSRRVQLAGLLVVVLAAVIGVRIAASDDDDAEVSTANPTSTSTGADSTSTTSTTSVAGPTAPNLVGAAADLAAALAHAATLDYHARYEGVDQREDGSTTNYVIEVWLRPPDARRDTSVSRADGEILVREYSSPTGDTVCFDQGTGSFTCSPTEAGQTVNPEAVAFDAVDPAGGPVTLVGSCYQVAAAEAVQEICLDAEGIPEIVDDGSLRLVRSLLERDVADSDLALPA